METYDPILFRTASVTSLTSLFFLFFLAEMFNSTTVIGETQYVFLYPAKKFCFIFANPALSLPSQTLEGNQKSFRMVGARSK